MVHNNKTTYSDLEKLSSDVATLPAIGSFWIKRWCGNWLGEVVIRQALSELDVWEVEAKFSFVGHQASTGEEVPLIKDWKDILNKVWTERLIFYQLIFGVFLFL